MTGRDAASVRLDGPRARRLRWYRALAHHLTGASPPAGALFEGSSEAPGPFVTVRPASLLTSLATSPVGEGVTAIPLSAPPSLDPAGRSPGRIGVIVPRWEGRSPRPGLASLPPDLPSLGASKDAGAWFGLQTFWVRRDGGALDMASRIRVMAKDVQVRDRASDVAATRWLAGWRAATGTAAEVRWLPRWSVGDWRRGGIRSVPPSAWLRCEEVSPRTAELVLEEFRESVPGPRAHTVVFGASGAGKTTFLAARAAGAIAAGHGVVVLDLHGDLAPQVLARVAATDRPRVIAVDASARPVPGVAGLVAAGPSVERAAAHFVAAVKRLSPDGTELAWGFRLERIFDTFARVVLDVGGSLLDLYALLTDPDRRDSARLATRRPSAARFLDELAPIVRRDPEFLWSAATRLSKVVLVPALRELLAPADGGLAVEELVEKGRALLVRLPLAALGPEGASFAGTLVLGRLYLGLAARSERPALRRPTLVVLDEVQSFSPRMVAELLAEGRKFGLEALVATQYPERLAPEVRSAAAGAAGSFVSFRIPPATAASVGAWVGLAPSAAVALLPGLPVGTGVTVDPEGDGVGPTLSVGPTAAPDLGDWGRSLDATRTEFGTPAETDSLVGDEPPVERVLLAVLAAEEGGTRLRPEEVVPAALELPGDPVPAELVERSWTRLVRGPELEVTADAVRLSAAGERRLGLARPTGATRETSEHRALLVRAFRVFARRGYRLEILRQGRFDTTLPDAWFQQLGRAPGDESPAGLAARLDRARTGWAWRFFSGRDVHVEAEVSGALRPERIRHGVTKAAGRGAFVLFVVGDAPRARRVRQTLRTLGLPRGRAQVWTLGPRADRPNG